MIYTLGSAREKLYRFAGTGFCADSPEVAAAIEEAMRNLLAFDDRMLTAQRIRVFVQRNVICCPRGVDQIVAARGSGKIPFEIVFYNYKIL